MIMLSFKISRKRKLLQLNYGCLQWHERHMETVKKVINWDGYIQSTFGNYFFKVLRDVNINNPQLSDLPIFQLFTTWSLIPYWWNKSCYWSPKIWEEHKPFPSQGYTGNSIWQERLAVSSSVLLFLLISELELQNQNDSTSLNSASSSNEPLKSLIAFLYVIDWGQQYGSNTENMQLSAFKFNRASNLSKMAGFHYFHNLAFHWHNKMHHVKVFSLIITWQRNFYNSIWDVAERCGLQQTDQIMTFYPAWVAPISLLLLSSPSESFITSLTT